MTLIMVAGLTGGAAGTADPGSPGSPVTVTDELVGTATGRPAAGRQNLPATATVTLITGEQVRLDVSPTGGQDVTVLTEDGQPVDSGGSLVVQFSFAGDQYVVPTEAVPYLGSTLDPRLFNVSYLVRAKLDDAHSRTLPVTMKRIGGGVGLPGETTPFAKPAGSAFGKRLADQWRSSLAGSPTPVGKLPDIARVSLVQPQGAPPLPEAPPGLDATGPGGPGSPGAASGQRGQSGQQAGTRYRTITINPIDRSGKPGVAVGFVHNLDEPRKFSMYVRAAGAGPLSFSVPEGQYGVEFSILDRPFNDRAATGALVFEPEVAMTSDRTITLDARRAVPYDVELDSPVDVGWRSHRVSFTRATAARDGANTSAWINVIFDMRLIASPRYPTRTIYVAPTPPVTKGIFELAAFTSFSDTERGSVNPRHRFAFSWDRGVPATLTQTVRRADLTPVRSTMYRSASGGEMNDTVSYNTNVFTPWSHSNIGSGGSVAYGERLDYFYSNRPDHTVWQSYSYTDDGMHIYNARRKLTPGQEIREEWNKGPKVHSAAARYVKDNFATGGPDGNETLWTACAACRQDDNGMVYIWPYSDSRPGSYGESVLYFDPERFSLDFYRNGTLALTSRSAMAGTLFPTTLNLPLLPERAGYRLEWAQSITNDPLAWTKTAWTFSSAPADPAAALPPGARCVPDPRRGCSFLPLLFLRYDLPVGIDAKAPAGAPFEVAFTVGAQQHQARPAGVIATVSTSFDGGSTWTDAAPATDRGDGRFTATVTHPPLADTNGFVALRVTARDADGNAVDQTITRAYGLAGQS